MSHMSSDDRRLYDKIRRRMARAARSDKDTVDLPLNTPSAILDQLEADEMYVEYKVDAVHGDYWEVSW